MIIIIKTVQHHYGHSLTTRMKASTVWLDKKWDFENCFQERLNAYLDDGHSNVCSTRRIKFRKITAKNDIRDSAKSTFKRALTEHIISKRDLPTQIISEICRFGGVTRIGYFA